MQSAAAAVARLGARVWPRTATCTCLAAGRRQVAATRGLAEITHIPSVEGVPAPGVFSRAVVHAGLVYVSGTGASNDTASGPVGDDTAGAQTHGALANVAAILRAAGSSPARIVSATMLLTDRQDYDECNEAYLEFFQEHGLGERLPARSTAMWGVPTAAKVAFSVVAATAADADADP